MNTGSLNGFSHNPERVTASARTFVTGAVAASEPFFLFMNPTMPHAPDVLTAFGNRWLTVDGTLVESGTATGADAGTIRDTPQSRGGGAALTTDPNSGMTPRSTLWNAALSSANNNVARAKKLLAGMWIDDMMGSLLRHLTAQGVLDDTLILFIMDHGVGAKGALYEAGSRIAMMARYPNGGFTKGAHVNDLVSNIDIAPSFLQLATGAAPATHSAASALDGNSFVGLATAATAGGAALTTTRHNFIEINKDRAIVTSRFKYIRVAVEAGGGGCGKGSTSGPDPSTSYPGYGTAEQLYDLSVDATEQTNVAADATYVDDVKALRLEMDCHLKDTDITLAAPTYKDCSTGAVVSGGGGGDMGGGASTGGSTTDTTTDTDTDTDTGTGTTTGTDTGNTDNTGDTGAGNAAKTNCEAKGGTFDSKAAAGSKCTLPANTGAGTPGDGNTSIPSSLDDNSRPAGEGAGGGTTTGVFNPKTGAGLGAIIGVVVGGVALVAVIALVATRACRTSGAKPALGAAQTGEVDHVTIEMRGENPMHKG